MMPDCKLDVTGAPVIGFSAWLGRNPDCQNINLPLSPNMRTLENPNKYDGTSLALMSPMNSNIELVQIENREHAQALGNLSQTFRNQLRRAIGKHDDVVFCYDCGTARAHRDGKQYDWWLCADGTLAVQEAE